MARAPAVRKAPASPRRSKTPAPVVSLATRRAQLIRRAIAAKKAHNDLIDFTRFMMPVPDAPDDVARSLYVPVKHHYVIAAALEEVEKGNYKILIVNLPPRHGKTELASKKFIPWYAGRHPERSVIFGTYNEKFAGDIGRSVRSVMQSAPYNQVFPRVKLKDGSAAVDRLELEQGGVLAFVGRGGTTTGRGGDLLVIDDPIKDRMEANSPTIRDALWDWFNQVIGTRMMSKDACTLLIQTRWHEDDLVGRLTDPSNDFYDEETAKKIKIIDLPALALDNDLLGRPPETALWPEKFDEEFLQAKRRQDPRGFAALYQGRPAPQGGAFFVDQHIRTYKPSDIQSKELRYYVASDHAVSIAQNRDKTCIIPVGVDGDNNIYVMPDVWWRHASSDQVVNGMLDTIRKYRPLYWWAEKTHITKSIGPFLRKRMLEAGVFCSIMEVTPIADKQTRAQSIQGRMAMGKVFFPERTPWFHEARDQLLKFPQAQHDDFVDALAYIGLGLNLIFSVSPARKDQHQQHRPGTFGAMLAESRQRRRKELADQDPW